MMCVHAAPYPTTLPHPVACVPLRRVYVHCTAGLGRAPAVAIAYLYVSVLV